MMADCEKRDVRKISNQSLLDTLVECRCDNYYRDEWMTALNELEKRLGIKREKIDEAIAHFNHGLSHGLFSEDMIRVARISLEALEKMREDM